jgi:hypothetical protein
MTGSPPSGPTSFIVSVLPARAVYLIRAGSHSGFRRAIQEASTRWGGVTEPIIPVRKGGGVDDWGKQAVGTANVNAAVNVDVPASDAQRAAEELDLPLVELARIDHHGPASWTVHPSALPTPRDYELPLAAGVRADLWMAVAAGDVTAEHESAIAGDVVSFRRVDQPDQVARAALNHGTLLDRTAVAFSEQWEQNGSGKLPAIVWVTKRNGLLDCLLFWNLRALRSLKFGGGPMLLLPDDQIQHWLEFGRQFRGTLLRPDEFSPDVLIASLSLDRGQLDAIAGELDLVPTTSEPRTGRRWPAPTRSSPFTYTTTDDFDPRQWFLAKRRYGESTEIEGHMQSGRATLRLSSSVAWRRGGTTLLNMRGPVLDALPKRAPVANMVISNGVWREGAVEIATNAMATYVLAVSIPTLGEALEAVLTATTSKHALSDKGKLGVALSDRAQDLLAPGVFEAAVSLATPRSKELTKELRSMRARGDLDEHIAEVASTWGGRTERRFRTAAQLGKPTGQVAVSALETLSAIGWAERGFQISCTRCGVTGFVALQLTASEARCPGCGSSQQYTTTKSGPGVYYRLNTLADRGVDQGVLPHLLVAAALTKMNNQTEVLLGVDVTFPDGDHLEVDIIGSFGGRVIAGEVKTNPSDFTAQQVRRDVRCSQRLQADIHLMAAIGSIPDGAKQQAQKAVKAAGLELLILEGKELRPSQASTAGARPLP